MSEYTLMNEVIRFILTLSLIHTLISVEDGSLAHYSLTSTNTYDMPIFFET